MSRTPQAIFEGWKQFYSLRPFGDDWKRTAVLAAASVNPHVKRAYALKPEKMVPKHWWVEGFKAKQTPEQVANVFESFFKAMNSVKRR